MLDFSIITCVSQPEVYHKCLLASVNSTRKDFDIEIIPIINNNNQYSASNALNVGIDAAKSNNLIFVHQDVRLLSDWFDRLASVLSELNDEYGIIGSAGINLNYGRGDIGMWGGALRYDTVAIGSVWDNDEGLSEPPYWNGTKEVARAHCADECLFVLNKRLGLRFDAAFNGFHFYGVDMCLQARAAGYDVYCADLPIIHYGKYSASFTGDHKYWVYLRYLHNKWRLRFPEMLGTHMHWADKELTSYISIELDDSAGTSVGIVAMGVRKARVESDTGQHFIDGDE